MRHRDAYTSRPEYLEPRVQRLAVPPRAQRVTLAVAGLYFEHSEIGLANQLRGMPGIIDVGIDTRAGTASITFDPGRWREKAICRLIDACGYSLARDMAVRDSSSVAASRRPERGLTRDVGPAQCAGVQQ